MGTGVVDDSKMMGTIPEVPVTSVVVVDNKYGTKPAVLGVLEGVGVEELDGSSDGEEGAGVEELEGSSVGEEGGGEGDGDETVLERGGAPQIQVQVSAG